MYEHEHFYVCKMEQKNSGDDDDDGDGQTISTPFTRTVDTIRRGRITLTSVREFLILFILWSCTLPFVKNKKPSCDVHCTYYGITLKCVRSVFFLLSLHSLVFSPSRAIICLENFEHFVLC